MSDIVSPVVKSQRVRQLDVFLIAPLMLYSAHLIPKKHGWVRLGLAVFGASTLLYNARNYYAVREISGMG